MFSPSEGRCIRLLGSYFQLHVGVEKQGRRALEGHVDDGMSDDIRCMTMTISTERTGRNITTVSKRFRYLLDGEVASGLAEGILPQGPLGVAPISCTNVRHHHVTLLRSSRQLSAPRDPWRRLHLHMLVPDFHMIAEGRSDTEDVIARVDQ